MSKFKYPVDTDQFAEIRQKGLVYVDKTDIMFDLVDKYKYVFLARPRRFGKSLLCNTFKAYFFKWNSIYFFSISWKYRLFFVLKFPTPKRSG